MEAEKESLQFSVSDHRRTYQDDGLALQNIRANEYGIDRRRFIAHAGGSIDGHRRTNSLEAMNLSYKLGFRLFELDILKTSDGEYVAVHDWELWGRKTGYKGVLPPTLKSFMAHKLHGEYNPMDLQLINSWFRLHSDATLVSDKVNSPQDFSKKFIDKSRLMMELFSWDAVREGTQSGIKSAMPTRTLLDQIKGDKITFMKNIGVNAIVSSRLALDTESKLFLEMFKEGFKIYAFDLDSKAGTGGKHIACHEQQYFFGVYADDWNFDSILDCSKK